MTARARKILKNVIVLGAGHTKNLVARSHFWLAHLNSDYKRTTTKINVYLTLKENTHTIRVEVIQNQNYSKC